MALDTLEVFKSRVSLVVDRKYAQKHDPEGLALTSRRASSLAGIGVGGGASVPISGVGLCGDFQAQSAIDCGNLCLRQQLLVLHRRHPRPRLSNVDRCSWVLASRWLRGWRRCARASGKRERRLPPPTQHGKRELGRRRKIDQWSIC